MLRHVALFELRYQLGSPTFKVTALFFFLLAFGAAASDSITIGGNGGNVLANAPFVVAQTAMILSLFALFASAAFVANSIVRDDETRFGGILHSTRLKTKDYLLGRFMGAWCAAMLALASIPLGNALGAAMPWLDPETVGPFRADSYLSAWLVLCGPTLLVTSAVLYAIALLTRSMALTYVGAITLIVGYLIGVGLVQNPRLEGLVALLDPFGLAALAVVTKYWTALERNTLVPGLEGQLLWNRVLWVATTIALLGLALRFYRVAERGQPERGARRSSPPTPAEEPRTTDARTASPKRASSAPPAPLHGSLPALWALVRHDMAAAFRHPGFLVLLFIGAVNSGGGLWFADELNGTPTLPVTRVMIEALRGSFGVIPILIAIYYAGELVWQSRDRRMHEILDATPAPDWAFALPKMLAIALVLVATLCGSMLVAMAVQLLKGYSELELSHYLLWYVLPSSIDVTLFAILAVFVQTLVPSKQLGWLAMTGILVAQVTLSSVGFEHPLYLYGQTTPEPLSDMNGRGVFAGHAAWFRGYWSACALLLAMLAMCLWRRGAPIALRTRLRRLPTRLAGFPGVVAGVSLCSMGGLGGWILYNTNVLNEYRVAEDEDGWAAQLERTVAGFESLPQPRITDVELDVRLYPGEGRAEVRGRYTIENRTGAPIPEVHVNHLLRDTDVRKLAVAGSTLEREWPELNYRIFRFDSPLAPGARSTIEFELQREQRGFRHRSPDTRLVGNGTFLDNFELAPTLGPNRGQYLSDRAERRKRDLPGERREPALEDESARAFNGLRRDSDWVQADITVTTDADQVAIAPGYIVSDETRDGRRTLRYRTDAPIQNFFSIQSARYAVERDRWREVELAVYHHPAHDQNVRGMLDAMRASLELYSEIFSPFQFRQLRVLEFPAYADFAQSFANTIPYSEALGFIHHRTSPDQIDMVTYITAHEVAHQWWGHQVIAADQQGGAMLIESLSQYSALRVMEQLHGPEQIRRFLKRELDTYLRSRGGERLEELPLARVENQGYIHYQKGGLALYFLKEELGADAVDRTLRRLIAQFAFQPAPYPNTSDFLRFLREEAGPGHEQLIADLFERITLYDAKVTSARTRAGADGQWETTLVVEARKLYANGQGQESEAPLEEDFEVGLFASEPGSAEFTRDSVLSFERRPVRSGHQEVVLRSATRPQYAGVDPYNKRIDRETDDNLVAVESID